MRLPTRPRAVSRPVRLPAILGLALLTAFATAGAACSNAPPAKDPNAGGTTGGTTSGQGTEGVESPGEAPAGQTNSYGVAYPTDDLGYASRKGATPGNRIKNYRFLGYKNGDATKGLEMVQLSDYFDPENRQVKLLHIIASSVWCGPCNQETSEVSRLYSSLAGKGVVVIQALVDGPELGTGATPKDLTGWSRTHSIGFTTMLDPGLTNLGVFFDAAAVPWNAFVDARTMEILDAGVGALPSVELTLDNWLQWVARNPPRN